MSSWDEVWTAVARTVARKSRCARAQVGAVIVDTSQRVVATGYNGPPAGYETEGSCLDWCERAREGHEDPSYVTCPSLHAEQNALMYSDRSLRLGGTIYVTSNLCMTCAKSVGNSGLARVVILGSPDADAYRNPSAVVGYLEACGLTVEYMEDIDDNN